MKVIGYCMRNEKELLQQYLKKDSVAFEEDSTKEMSEKLLKNVMSTCLPARKALLGMVISHLPSPAKAQQYRVENLYKGPLNDIFANAVRKCDPSGPLLVYIAKKIPSSNPNKFGVVARVFSGTIEPCMNVKIMGPNHIVHRKGFHMQMVEDIFMLKGRKYCQAEDGHPGNIVILFVHIEDIPACSTLTSMDNYAHPIRALEYPDSIEDASFNSFNERNRQQLAIPISVYNDLFLYQREGIRWMENAQSPPWCNPCR